MSYIAVELKVIESLAAKTARAAGTTEDRVLAGLVRLWHGCWVATSDHVSELHLSGVFGPENLPLLIAALVAHEFLEECQEGGWRVRGAGRYLRLKEARRAGAAKTNAARAESRSRASLSDAPARSRATLSDAQATLPNALPPNTEHRRLKDFAPQAAPRDSDALCQAFQELTGSAYVWQGARDGVALAALLKASDMPEVLRRWRLGLQAPTTAWASCRTVAQLRSKWNDLVDTKQTQQPKRARLLE